MTVKPLEEDFRRMGLSGSEISESLQNMGVTEAGPGDETDEEVDLDDDAYLSDLVGDDEDGDGDEDGLDERTQRLHKQSMADRREARQRYAKHAAQIRRERRVDYKKPDAKRRRKKLANMPKAGPHKRRMVSDVDNSGLSSMHESLMSDLAELAESVEYEPVSRFDEYVEAFNHIADMGEILAMDLLDEDEEAAAEVLRLSLNAEAVLKMMEDFGGALSTEEDELLEEALADAMDDVGTTLDQLGVLAEDEDIEDEDEDEDEDIEDEIDEDEDEGYSNPFLEMAAQLREARGGKTAQREGKPKRRMLLNPKSAMATRKASKWGKIHGKGATKRQVFMRKDVDNKQGLLGYLKKVKQGLVAPGQPMGKSKALAKAKAKAKRKAG